MPDPIELAQIPPPDITCRWFPGHRTEIAKARSFVADRLADCPRADDAVLTISELATNAIQHTASAGWRRGFMVTIEHWPNAWVRLTVHDLGSPHQPQPTSPTSDDERGRGLHLVNAIADDWGHSTWSTTHDTWAEFKCG